MLDKSFAYFPSVFCCKCKFHQYYVQFSPEGQRLNREMFQAIQSRDFVKFEQIIEELQFLHEEAVVREVLLA